MEKSYYLNKLSDINYRISTHPGNASQRLASEASKILLISPDFIHEDYQKDYRLLISLIEETLRNLSVSGAVPSKLVNTNNRTSVEFIKLLINIQDKLEH